MNATITEAALALRAAHDTGTPCPPVRDTVCRRGTSKAPGHKEANTADWQEEGRRPVGGRSGRPPGGAEASSVSTRPDFGVLLPT